MQTNPGHSAGAYKETHDPGSFYSLLFQTIDTQGLENIFLVDRLR